MGAKGWAAALAVAAMGWAIGAAAIVIVEPNFERNPDGSFKYYVDTPTHLLVRWDVSYAYAPKEDFQNLSFVLGSSGAPDGGLTSLGGYWTFGSTGPFAGFLRVERGQFVPFVAGSIVVDVIVRHNPFTIPGDSHKFRGGQVHFGNIGHPRLSDRQGKVEAFSFAAIVEHPKDVVTESHFDRYFFRVFDANTGLNSDRLSLVMELEGRHQRPAVPAPPTLFLAASGLAALGLWRRRARA